MRILLLSLFSIFTFPFTASAQITFEKTYGGPGFDDAHCMKPTADGGYVIAGSTWLSSGNSMDAALIKIDSIGNQVWFKSYGGQGDEDIHFLAITSDSGFIITGHTNSYGAGGEDVFVIKTDEYGDTLWTKTFGGAADDASYGIIQTSDGNFAVIGKTKSSGNGGEDIYFLKIDPDGNLLIQKTYGGTVDDFARSVDNTSDQGFIIAGTTCSTDSGDAEMMIMKINANGDSLWNKTFDFDSVTYGYSVEETSDLGFIVAGYGYSYWGEYYSIVAVKTDSAGNKTWHYNSSNYDFTFYSSKASAHAITQISDGTYLVSGANDVELICKTTVDSGYYPSNLLLLNLTSNGNINWYREYYQSNGINEMGTFAAPTADGGFIVCGYQGYDYKTDGDIYVLKTDASGMVLSTNDEKSPSNVISVYPNPNRGNFSINLMPFDFEIPTDLKIYNVLGDKVCTSSIIHQHSSITTSLPAGIYFLKIGNSVSRFTIVN